MPWLTCSRSWSAEVTNLRPTRLTTLCLLWLVFLTSGMLRAQPTNVQGANFDATTRPLAALVDNDDWLAYRVPLVEGAGAVCCYQSYGHSLKAGCDLVRNRKSGNSWQTTEDFIHGNHLVVFIAPNATGKHHHRVQAYDSSCPIKASGLRIKWLGDLAVSESLDVLTPWAQAATGHDHSALSAIAHHAGDRATDVLSQIVNHAGHGDSLRASAAFWLGAQRGLDGFRVLDDIFDTVDRPSLREELVAALAQSEVPAALDRLINIARHDRSPSVRGNGLFWLAQTANSRVPRVLLDAAEQDPDNAVKEKAVFALSQLPSKRGVPLLIDVAQQNASATVRERAVFWLGQSEDPRALEFIVSMLDR